MFEGLVSFSPLSSESLLRLELVTSLLGESSEFPMLGAESLWPTKKLTRFFFFSNVLPLPLFSPDVPSFPGFWLLGKS